MKNRKHILIVDDVTTNLRYIGEVLKDNYTLSMAKSGEQAFKMIEKALPDLILLDVKMPGMDGFSVISKLSDDDRYKDIPVIFLSADSQEETEIKGLKLGAVDFISKPFSPEEIQQRIREVLGEEN